MSVLSAYVTLVVSSNRHPVVVKLLLDAIMERLGDDLDVSDSYGDTTLMYASSNGHADVVSLLIDGGAEVDLEDITGFTALMNASMAGRAQIVRMLAGGGADVNHRDVNGMTALIHASQDGHVEGVRVLLSIPGVKLQIVDHTRRTALKWAIHEGHTDVMELLRAAGAPQSLRISP